VKIAGPAEVHAGSRKAKREALVADRSVASLAPAIGQLLRAGSTVHDLKRPSPARCAPRDRVFQNPDFKERKREAALATAKNALTDTKSVRDLGGQTGRDLKKRSRAKSTPRGHVPQDRDLRNPERKAALTTARNASADVRSARDLGDQSGRDLKKRGRARDAPRDRAQQNRDPRRPKQKAARRIVRNILEGARNAQGLDVTTGHARIVQVHLVPKADSSARSSQQGRRRGAEQSRAVSQQDFSASPAADTGKSATEKFALYPRFQNRDLGRPQYPFQVKAHLIL
jgi:hypothetical protein